MKFKKILVLVLTLYITVNGCKKDGPEPLVHPGVLSTCEQMKLLENNKDFIAHFKTLYKEATINNFETGFVLIRKVNETIGYQKITGEENKASISFNVPNAIDGFIHAHYSNLYPNFSTADVKAMYHVYEIRKMKDPNSFILGLVTAAGDAYILRIADLNLFKAFGKANFDDEIASDRFERRYEGKIVDYKQHDRSFRFEMALLDMLKNSGLVLFKTDTEFNRWRQLIKEDGGNVSSLACQ